MPFIKLNRINKGGAIVLNTTQVVFIEVEGKSTTVHLGTNLLFSVEESPEAIAAMVEKAEAAPIKAALLESGVGKATG